MPPRKTRVAKKKVEKEVVETVVEKVEEIADGNQTKGAIPTPAEKHAEKPSKGKGKASLVKNEPVVEKPTQGEDEVSVETNEAAKGGKLSQEERLAKLKELRMRMNQSTLDNRKTLIEDHQKTRTTAREVARLEKQKRLAENLREKINADEAGDDVQRKKNWNYSIEQNERWEERMKLNEEKGRREFNDEAAGFERRYLRDTSQLKVNMTAYRKQKEVALGLPAGTLVPVEVKSNAVASSSSKAAAGTGEAYGEANSLSYAKDRPSDDAIDNVMSDMNAAYDRKNKAAKKRRTADEDEQGDVTYINQRNKVFNQKINRFFDKYTQEIRENFERGTAL
ncbi:hypothetical protein QFC22_000266 [Naganishia vaughanmartiniae]|uniref:Uncharacterized protein n=1 Tax=Naganishia vaughanmartiniae TaxID=1424756 RepID=A0ACC2XPL0_9TREE|nr:hypothetical protein QFC22_000266 [Naganishia vaughanmartiniae]